MGDNLWVELGWVRRLHEAFAGGEMGRPISGCWGFTLELVRKDCREASKAHPERGEAGSEPPSS